MLIGYESKEQFESLLSGLRNSWKPVGEMEEILVDLLASSFWRYRRLLKAESAEIEKAQPSNDISDDRMLTRALWKNVLIPNQGSFETAFLNHSSIDLMSTQGALRRLCDKIREEGLSWERDRDTLEATFGRYKEPAVEQTNDCEEEMEVSTERNRSSFMQKYREAAERSREDARSADQSAKAILEQIEDLLEYLEPIGRRWFEEEEVGRCQSRAAALIPKPEITEKLLRYQITLERSIDRTITQLERLQRMRLGQPIAPPIKVQIAD
jgi:hypothetical protein